jgi:hypothetical protein
MDSKGQPYAFIVLSFRAIIVQSSLVSPAAVQRFYFVGSSTMASPASGAPADPATIMSKQLEVTISNLRVVDASIAHSLAVAADTADELASARGDTDALASLMEEYAQCVQGIGSLLHDEIDKLGGPIAIAVAKVAHGGVPLHDRPTVSSAKAAVSPSQPAAARANGTSASQTQSTQTISAAGEFEDGQKPAGIPNPDEEGDISLT